MRYIKFRIWDKKKKKMFYQEEHSWTGSNGFISIAEVYTGYKDSDEWKNYEVMQFTGMKDKNGVEIFEGDIVKMDNIITGSTGLEPGFIFGEDDIVYIAWDNEIGAWSVGGDDFDSEDRISVAYRNQIIQLIHQNSCKVIGNVYENPELLINKRGKK